MTKKHFIAIARVLSDAYGSQAIGEDMRAGIIEALKKEFKKFNPLFNTERFGSACNGWLEDLK